jgi:hypothetical protein
LSCGTYHRILSQPDLIQQEDLRCVCYVTCSISFSGRGSRLQVADVVPKTNSIRQWTDTFPWTKLVEAVEQSFASRFPKRVNGGRPPVPTRVLLALELLKHEVGASDEAIYERLRSDVAVMYVCGLDEVQLDSPQEHFVLPETLAQFRSHMDGTLIAELLALQAAAALQSSSWHQQSCFLPVHYAALRAFPPLTSTSDIRKNEEQRIKAQSIWRNGNDEHVTPLSKRVQILLRWLLGQE